MLVLSLNSKVYAAETQDPFAHIVEQVFSHERGVYVENEDGHDVTNEFIRTNKSYYKGNDIEKIKDYLCNEHLSIVCEKESAMTNENSQFKSVSKLFYFILDSKEGIGKIEVGSELVGGIWYKRGSGEVVRTSTPTYRVYYIGAGAGYNISTNDFKSSSYVSNGVGYFSGECSFLGNFHTTENGVPISFTEHFGTKRVGFNTTEKGIL